MADEEIIEYKKGSVIFNQGDPGGDLFFIQAGKIQIFTMFAGKIIPLSTMTTGEVLGILTCLTNKERMASARALEDTKVKKVKYNKITKIVSELPEWMKIVLKDFSLRLEQMNENYSRTAHHIELLSINQINYFYTSAQLASAIASCAGVKKIIVEDNTEAVFPDEIIEFLEPVLLKSKAELEAIFDIFVDCGMIRLKIEQEKKRKYFTVADAQKIRDYSEFISQTRRKKIKKLLDTRITNRELRVLGGILRYVEKKNIDTNGEIEIDISELNQRMEKEVGQKFEEDAVFQFREFSLVTISGEGDSKKFKFAPKNLSHTLSHISVYKRISGLNASSLSKKICA